MENKTRFEPKNKSEWFVLDSPLGEPDIDYIEEDYWIERVAKVNGEIVWFGQGTNWVCTPEGQWTVLGEDETVEPTKTYYNEDGTVSGHDYPEGRSIFIPCEMPIYEKLYRGEGRL